MLDILVLALMARRLGRAIRDKGRKAYRYQLMTVALWFGGQILFGYLASLVWGFGEEDIPQPVTAAALIGAIAGAVAAVVIVRTRTSLAETPSPPEG